MQEDYDGSFLDNEVSDVSYNRETPIEKVILPEIKHLDFLPLILVESTDLYDKIVAGKTRRNAPRRGIIYCCIVLTCKKHQVVFDPDKLRRSLKLKLKDVNTARSIIEQRYPNMKISIDINDILKSLIKQNDINEMLFDTLKSIYDNCRNVSPLFNSSRPATLGTGIIYYYLKEHLDNFNEDEFFNKCRVSKETANNIYIQIKKYKI